MARPRSEEKRLALIDACIKLMALRGVDGVSTAAVSSRAGVAEGTLFRYFASKDILLSEVYRSIKLELSQQLSASPSEDCSIKEQFSHVWITYIYWLKEHGEQFSVLQMLESSTRISDAVRAEGKNALQRIDLLASRGIALGEIRSLPKTFFALAFNSLAIATLESLVGGESSNRGSIERGFEVFWRGIAA